MYVVRVCVPLRIDYWTQGIITHRNSTVQIRIRECSSLRQNWSIEARTELCKQIIRIQDCVRVCVFVPLTIDYWTQGLITHRNRKQYSSDQNQRMFKPRTEMEYWSQGQNCAASRMEIENYWNVTETKNQHSTIQIKNKIIIGPKDCYLTETENSSDKTRNGYHRNLAQYSTHFRSY